MVGENERGRERGREREEEDGGCGGCAFIACILSTLTLSSLQGLCVKKKIIIKKRPALCLRRKGKQVKIWKNEVKENLLMAKCPKYQSCWCVWCTKMVEEKSGLVLRILLVSLATGYAQTKQTCHCGCVMLSFSGCCMVALGLVCRWLSVLTSSLVNPWLYCAV